MTAKDGFVISTPTLSLLTRVLVGYYKLWGYEGYEASRVAVGSSKIGIRTEVKKGNVDILKVRYRKRDVHF